METENRMEDYFSPGASCHFFSLPLNFACVVEHIRLKIKAWDALQEDLKSDPGGCTCEVYHRTERLLMAGGIRGRQRDLLPNTETQGYL